MTETNFGYTNQRNYADMGLMDYNARFYSPTLGRFIQADTVIPDLTNSQAWNRYSYTMNSPIMYVDPSGHVPDSISEGLCMDGDVCGELRSGRAVEAAKLASWGIVAHGATLDEKLNMLEAARLAGEKFSSFIGNGISARMAFHSTHGNITIIIDPNADTGGDGNCKTVGGTITCKSGMTVTNALHEYGHVFDNYYKEVMGDLASAQLPTAAYEERTSEGYMCNKSPCMEHSHITYPDSGYNREEEWADMYMNLILDGNPSYPDNGFTNDVPDAYAPYTRAQWMGYWLDVKANDIIQQQGVQP